MLQQAQMYRRRARLALAAGAVLALSGFSLIASDAFAQEAEPEIVGPVAAPVAPVAPVTAPNPATALDNPLALVGVITNGVQHGNWGTVAAGVLVLLVALLRMFGKKLHDHIPDDAKGFMGFVESCLHFLYDTKPGGWLLNTTFATAGGFGMTLLAGQSVTFELARAVVGVSFTAAGIWGLVKDVLEWWKNRKPPADAAQAAGVEAGKSPGAALNG